MEKKLIAQNKKARHDYFVLDAFEAGIELSGTEVKSIRQGRVNLKDCYATVDNGELIVHGMHISPYEKGNIFNKNPLRERKLLMHRKEIDRLSGAVMKDGNALIPLSLYWNGPNVKVELGLCKGKKLYDKREDAARKSAAREMDRAVKDYRRT